MKQCILMLAKDNEYAGGTRITMIAESEIGGISDEILQIMPLASGKFLIERTR